MNKKFLSVILSIFCLNAFALALDFDQMSLSDIYISNDNDNLAVVILPQENLTNHSSFILDDPLRIVIDFPNCDTTSIPLENSFKNDYLTNYKITKFEKDEKSVTRVEIFIKEYYDYSINKEKDYIMITFPSLPSPKSEKKHLSQFEKGHETIGKGYDYPKVAESKSDLTSSVKPSGIAPKFQTVSDESYKKFTGKPISFDLKDADVVDIFRIFAEESGLNMVIDPDVRGKITIKIDEVPWDQAFDVIIKNQGLGYVIEGNIVRIATLKKLKNEAKERISLDQAQRIAAPLNTEIVYCSYLQSKKAVKILKKFLTKRGTVINDDRSNSIIIRDVAVSVDKIKRLITALDIQTPQISLYAQIVITKKEFTKKLGIQWSGNMIMDSAHGNTTGYRFPNKVASTGAVSLPNDAPQVLGFQFGDVLDTLDLSVSLHASEREGLTRLISNPRITVENSGKATIRSGTELAYYTYSSDGAKVTFREAVTKLMVIPRVTHDKRVQMRIELSKDAANYNTDPYTININQAKTNVLVADGDTIVIGGLNQVQEGGNKEKIPFLGDVPFINYLFKNKAWDNVYEDLLFFITPTIVKMKKEKTKTLSLEKVEIEEDGSEGGE